MKILITGIAGFIGAHLAKQLASENYNIIGIDNINNYYDQQLKYDRLNDLCGVQQENNKFEDYISYQSSIYSNLQFIKMDLTDKIHIDELFKNEQFDKVINLAAQAGVRYSIDHPYEYINSNIIGFMNILEACKQHNVKHLIFASSSSVYGANSNIPFKEDDQTDKPLSLYAATKKSNEVLSYSYAKLYKMHITGLRFFTVYGPYGRPDMAPTLFAKALLNNEKIKVFNNGNLYRDFTYIDDIIMGISYIIKIGQNISKDNLYYGIYNIGCGHKEQLLYFIETIENAYGKKAEKEYLPMQAGDAYLTYASIEKLEKDFGYKPCINIESGIPKFINWFKNYYNKYGE